MNKIRSSRQRVWVWAGVSGVYRIERIERSIFVPHKKVGGQASSVKM